MQHKEQALFPPPALDRQEEGFFWGKDAPWGHLSGTFPFCTQQPLLLKGCRRDPPRSTLHVTTQHAA